LNLAQQKDAAGHQVMMKLAKPRKPREGEDPNGIYWHEYDPRLGAYCQQDVEVERAAYHRVGHLSGEEQALWVLDAKINDRGVYLDGELLTAASKITKQARAEIAAAISEITSGEITSINQREKLQAWLGAHGCVVPDSQKETLRRALTRKELTDEVRRVLELRRDGAHIDKLGSMRNWRGVDGRARGALKFHGASTGRWTSYGIQLQNMKRPTVENMGAVINAVSTGSLAQVQQHHLEPLSAVGDLARAMICAAPGHRLIAADFSGIESRVTAWISGQQSKLDQWAKFDRTQNPEDEPYFVTGTRIFGLRPEIAREPGKTGDLAFGYMGGPGAWKKLAPPGDASTEAEIKQRQRAWRNAHPQTVRFWGAINRAAIQAVRKLNTVVECGRVAFKSDGAFLYMKLPSGRKLAYPFPRLKADKYDNLVVVFMDSQQGKWTECRFGHGAYGGIWIENAVQAVARDLFAAAMPRLEAAGYPIVLHVHDEIVAEVPDGFGSEEEFKAILLTVPAWATDLPLNAKTRNGPRFCKTKTTTDAPPLQPEISNFGDAEIAAGSRERTSEAPKGSRFEYNPADTTNDATNGYGSGEREWGRNTAAYIYRDAGGNPYLKVVRTSAKQFPQYHWDNGRWMKGKPAGPKIPYRLPELLAAPPSEPVWICEGEKDADNVAALGLIATTNSEGAGKDKWTVDLNKWFAGKRTAYILEDNDDDGPRHTREVASALQDIVPELRIVSFLELPVKGDVSDWIEAGGTREELIARAKAAPRSLPNGYVLVRASDIVPRAMDWLWYGHILRGSQELLTGIPGGGKSQIHCALVAFATTGSAWPDGCNGIPAGNVIMLTAEDCLDQTIVPRLIAAGADRDRVFILKKIRKDNKERMFLLHEDLEQLEQMIRNVGDVRLITIDPITAYMGGKVDSHRATDVRDQLGPLADLAERTNVALSAITHPPKHSTQRAIDHFIGSQAFIAAARIGHMAIEEIDEDEHGHRGPTGRSLFTNPKNNVCRKMPTLAYRITEKQVDGDIKAACVVWEESVDITADQAVAAATISKERGQQSNVVMFLLNILANGPVPVAVVEERAAASGFSKDQLNRARRKMSVVPFKEKGKLEGRWFWALPQHAPQEGVEQ
jgi:DNA polymerase